MIKTDGAIADKAEESINVSAGWAVLAQELKPLSAIVKELKGYKIHVIGDYLKPRRIYNAISGRSVSCMENIKVFICLHFLFNIDLIFG